MVISNSEKKVMKEMAAELWESIVGRVEERNIEIDRNISTDPKVIEERFDICPQKPRFSFIWQKVFKELKEISDFSYCKSILGR